MVPCAYLKVFQPLAAFSAAERDHWERYLVDGGAVRTFHPIYVERSARDGLGLLAPIDTEGADFRMVQDEYFLSPWRVQARVLHALLAMRESQVAEMAEQLVPEHEARKAARALRKMQRRDPFSIPFTQESAWHVPLRWFLLFKDEERRLVDRGTERHTLVYSTTVGKARRRLDWAFAVVQRSELEPLLEMLRDLQRWLAVFDRRSILELDYATLSTFLTWDELDDDHSARDIHDAIEALSIGEIARSADVYQNLAGRWAEVRSRESFN